MSRPAPRSGVWVARVLARGGDGRLVPLRNIGAVNRGESQPLEYVVRWRDRAD
jgi:hypothetical protein